MKIIDNLLNKATAKGFANINGRQSYYYGEVGPLESKYSAMIEDNVLTFTHWGTKTLELNLNDNTVLYYYGESISDRDALNNVLEYFNVSWLGRFHFYPSKELFTFEQNN